MRYTTRASRYLASRRTIWAQIFAQVAVTLTLPACSDSTASADSADAVMTQDTSGDSVTTDIATDTSPSALSRLPAPRTLSFCAGSTTGRYAPLSS